MSRSRLSFTPHAGLVIYLTAGDPDLATSKALALAAIHAGADVIELGVPFSDPVADGPVIQRASERALTAGTTTQKVVSLAAELRRECPNVGLIIMSYVNPLVRYGLERFVKDAAHAGVDGVLATDLPLEEAGAFRASMRANRLAPIFLAAPTTTEARLKTICAAAEGFLYAVSLTGITGARTEIAADAEKLVRRLRKFTKLPVALGFGVSDAKQFRAVTRFADAAVIGSAIMGLVEKHQRESPAAVHGFIRSLRA